MTYKTSFLHLQPRQMTVTVANNSNIRKPIPSKRSPTPISISKSIRPISPKITRTTSMIIHSPSNTKKTTYENSNLQRSLSSSDPTLNQTRKIYQQNQIVKKSFSIEQIPSDNDDDSEIEKMKQFRKYASPRHRLMTCTSGMNDSLLELSSFHVMHNRPP